MYVYFVSVLSHLHDHYIVIIIQLVGLSCAGRGCSNVETGDVLVLTTFVTESLIVLMQQMKGIVVKTTTLLLNSRKYTNVLILALCKLDEWRCEGGSCIAETSRCDGKR